MKEKNRKNYENYKLHKIPFGPPATPRLTDKGPPSVAEGGPSEVVWLPHAKVRSGYSKLWFNSMAKCMNSLAIIWPETIKGGPFYSKKFSQGRCLKKLNENLSLHFIFLIFLNYPYNDGIVSLLLNFLAWTNDCMCCWLCRIRGG